MARNFQSMLLSLAIVLALPSTAECLKSFRNQRLNLRHTISAKSRQQAGQDPVALDDGEDSDDDSDDTDQGLVSQANYDAGTGTTLAPYARTPSETRVDERVIEQAEASARTVERKEQHLMHQEKNTENWEKHMEMEDDDEGDGHMKVTHRGRNPVHIEHHMVDDDGSPNDDDDDEEDDEDTSAVPKRGDLLSNIQDAHTRLSDNLRSQVDVHLELKDLDNEKMSAHEIDASVQAVANETQAPLTAKFLGDMWKEMRQYSKPFYKEHLQVKLADLNNAQVPLEADVSKSQKALSVWPARMAPEPVASPVILDPSVNVKGQVLPDNDAA